MDPKGILLAIVATPLFGRSDDSDHAFTQAAQGLRPTLLQGLGFRV